VFDERLHGYYLHGRSPFAHADCDMLQLNANLNREEQGLVARRGLSSDSNLQTFEVYLSHSMGQVLQEVYTRRMRGVPRVSMSSSEHAVLMQREVANLFRSFVSKDFSTGSLRGHTLEVRPPAGFCERRFAFPPKITPYSTKSIFIEDPHGRFQSVLLKGCEYDLVLLQVLSVSRWQLVRIDLGFRAETINGKNEDGDCDPGRILSGRVTAVLSLNARW